MNKLIFIISILLLPVACENEPEKSRLKEITLEAKEASRQDFVPADMQTMYQLADTLFYTALLKPGTEEEALYMNDWVKNLKREQFVNLILNAVYEGRLTAYSYYGEEPLSIDRVKALEEENKNNAVAKFLFEEAWYFDDENLQLYKKVRSIMLAYERKDSEGKVKGYKSGFKVYMENKNPE